MLSAVKFGTNKNLIPTKYRFKNKFSMVLIGTSSVGFYEG